MTEPDSDGAEPSEVQLEYSHSISHVPTEGAAAAPAATAPAAAVPPAAAPAAVAPAALAPVTAKPTAVATSAAPAATAIDGSALQTDVEALRERLTRLETDFAKMIRQQAHNPMSSQPKATSVLTASDSLKSAIKRTIQANNLQHKMEEIMAGHNTVTSIMCDANHGGMAAKIFLFGGGLHSFKRPWQNYLYVTVWLLALTTCGSVCWMNLWYQKLPSHNFPTDLLTAYVHIPALQGWYFWRSRLRNVKFQSVVDSLSLATSKDKARFAFQVRWICRAVLASCIAFTALVLCAYKLPVRLENSRQVEDSYDFSSSFMWWHEYLMLAFIPPVVFSLLTSYSMFIFFCMLHHLDFLSTRKKLLANVPLLLEDRAAGVDLLTRSARFVARVESVALAAQARLDYTCNQWSSLGLHLLMFSTCQIMVVCANLESFMIGQQYENGDPYPWWWILQDVFHGVGGLVLNAIYFVCMTLVTKSCEKAVSHLEGALREGGASHAVRTQTSALLAASMSGARVFELNFNMETAVAFVWALVCTLWASFVAVLCDRVYWRDPSVRRNEAVSCPCLNTYDQSSYLVPGGVAATYPDMGVAFTYPYNYGLVSCAAHDYALPPHCNGTTVHQVEGWCSSSWCFVDETCEAEKAESTIFPGLWYSYAACGQSADSDRDGRGRRG